MNKKAMVSIGLLLIAIIPVWIWIVAPQLTKLPNNFSYTADIVSLDNFYNEATKQFSGEKRSVTKFSFETVDKKNGILTIKNTFDVRKVTGEQVFSVERIYGIDQKTGKHVQGLGDRDREGYLFAPRMKGFFRPFNFAQGEQAQDKEPFTYWHINYDNPAQLSYAGEEKLFGLPVYRFETRYEGESIDQTANLGFLPGVGVTRGVKLEPYLQIWIEPVSGRMVKYKDNTIAYYYDLKTGERQNPWNHFSNTYARDSVLDQVALVKSEKLQMILIETVVPFLLGLLGLTVFLSSHRRKVAIIVFILGIFGLGVLVFSRTYTVGGGDLIKVGIARWIENPLQEQNIGAFKDALKQAGYIEGKNVHYITPPASSADPTKHKQLIDSLIQENVDLIYSLTTPGTIIAKEATQNIPIVFSIVTYPVEAGLVKSLKGSGNNLVGTSNWVRAEEQLSNFLEIVPTVKSIGFVHKKDEPNSVIQFDEMKLAAGVRGINVIEIAPTRFDEITMFLEEFRARIDSLYLACDTLIQGEQKGEDAAIAFAKKYKIPDFSCIESGVRKGSLLGTVADFSEIGKRAGEKAGLILQGATPQSLETNTVARPFLYIHQATGKNLGLTIPQTLLTKVKEIIK